MSARLKISELFFAQEYFVSRKISVKEELFIFLAKTVYFYESAANTAIVLY